MRLKTKLIAAASGAALLISGGVGVVYATTSNGRGDAAITQPAISSTRSQTAAHRAKGDDEALTGTVAERAKAAAMAAVPGATVREIERERNADNPRVAYEVDLVTRDGSSVEVKLDANFKVVHIDRDHTDTHDSDTHDRDD